VPEEGYMVVNRATTREYGPVGSEVKENIKRVKNWRLAQ